MENIPAELLQTANLNESRLFNLDNDIFCKISFRTSVFLFPERESYSMSKSWEAKSSRRSRSLRRAEERPGLPRGQV